MEEEKRQNRMKRQHYYSEKPLRIGRKRTISLYIHGRTFEFTTYSSLFSGEEIDTGTRILLEYIKIPSEGKVLDIGCGYGVIGIVVAKLNPRLKVYMVDINKLAVKTARLNARKNSVEVNVVVLHGNLYEPVKEMKFNAIYSNPPLTAGKNIVEEIIRGAHDHLEEGGFIQLVLAKGKQYYVQLVEDTYSNVEKKRKKGYLIIIAHK